MPKITDIQKQIGNSTRFSIFVDGKFAFGLDGLILGSSSINKGSEISDLEVQSWVNKSVEAKAYNSAITYLSYRQRTESEVASNLISKGYSDQLILVVTGQLIAGGLIDDHEFAQSWVRDRLNLRPRSRRMLKMELIEKGINKSTIDEVLDDIDYDDEINSLKTLISKKTSRYDSTEKLINYLISVGYKYDLIKDALRR